MVLMVLASDIYRSSGYGTGGANACVVNPFTSFSCTSSMCLWSVPCLSTSTSVLVQMIAASKAQRSDDRLGPVPREFCEWRR